MPSLDTKFSLLRSDLMAINKTIFREFHRTKQCAKINDRINESLLLLDKCRKHSKRQRRIKRVGLKR